MALVEEKLSTNLSVFDKIVNLPISTNNLLYSLEEWLAQEDVKNYSIINFSQLKVLIVEDVDMSRKYIEEMFKVNFTINCDSVTNGKEAVDIVKNNNYDIIFMDIRMPVMNGLDATKAIRQFNKDIPIICMSADVYDEDMKVALDSGMNSFIEKPLDIEEIKKNFVEFLDVDITVQDNIRATRSSVDDLKINSLKNKAFNNLKEHFGADTATELLVTARESIEEYIDKISLKDRSTKDLKDDFHALKGVLLNLGLMDIAKSADDLQNTCMSESITTFKREKDDFIYIIKGFLEA
jgi:CheY-like chemotaxis protein/HPt (histidine-containing phosphotransfer) domain-containing protein